MIDFLLQLFGCSHPAHKRTLPFRNENGQGHYCVCLGCGMRADYNMAEMRLINRRDIRLANKHQTSLEANNVYIDSSRTALV